MVYKAIISRITKEIDKVKVEIEFTEANIAKVNGI